MSAASMAATSTPIIPAGTIWARKNGMANSVPSFSPNCSPIVSTTAGSIMASAAMPHRPGMIQRQTKKKAVPV